MDCTALSSTSSLARSFFPAVVMIPVPIGFVSTRRSPGWAPALVTCRPGSTKPGNGEPVLGLVVVDRVAADNEHARFSGLVGAALQHLAQYVCGQAGREGDYVQAEQRPGAGGVNVAERICGGYRAKGVWVVDDGRKEVHRLDQCDLVRQPVDGGVIGRCRSRPADWGRLVRVAGAAPAPGRLD